jgi:uncharacterized protein YegL
VYFLIDASGSMESIRGDVIGGFNTLLAAQRDDTDDASRATVVFFDSVEPNDVRCAGVPLREVTDLDERSYRPRGGTPLLDATGVLIQRADREVAAREAAGLPAEDILVVTITDGHENQSAEFRRSDILTMVEERRARGWEFSFLAADLAAFGDARTMGYAAAEMGAWDKTSTGTRDALMSMSTALLEKKQRSRSRRPRPDTTEG